MFGDFPTDWLDVKESESDAAQSELGNRCVLAELHPASIPCAHTCVRGLFARFLLFVMSFLSLSSAGLPTARVRTSDNWLLQFAD